MPYLERQGIRLFYDCKGVGSPPLVFVHGFACGQEDWKEQVAFFGARHCTVTCDLRGHGVSGPDPEHCDIETFGSDVIFLLEALELPPAILVGHSMGCRVVLQAYLEERRRVAALVFVDGSRVGSGEPEVVEQSLRDVFWSEGYSDTIGRMFQGMFLEGSEPELKERIINRALALPEEIGAKLLPRAFGWDARHMDEALSDLAVPLLLLQSTYINSERVRVPLQPGATTPWIDLVRQKVPTAQIEIVGGVGHFPMLEKSGIVNQAMEKFIAGLG